MKDYGRRKIIVNIFWIILGAALIAAALIGEENSMLSGMGGGLVGVGVIQLIRGIQYNTSEEYREKYNTEASDERNRFIRMKAWSWAGYLLVEICALVCIVCMIIGQSFYSQLVGMVVCLIIALYWISYMILKRKY